MKKSTILRFYSEMNPFCETFKPDDPEYKEAVHITFEKERELLSHLGENEKKIFDDYQKAHCTMQDIYYDELFRLGVSVGISIMKEADEVLERNSKKE